MPEQITIQEMKESENAYDRLRHLAEALNPDELVHEEEFKEWFGDWESGPDSASQMVDDEGYPKALFFGGPSGIEKLIGDKRGRTGSDEIGFYITPLKRYAKFYAEALRDSVADEPAPSTLYTVFVNARHPR